MELNHNDDNFPVAKRIPVRFEFTCATAITVCVAGTFNDWQPEAKRLRSSGVGNWWNETALAPGTYEYCFIVDGRWMPDPRAGKTAPNPYGGRNSILEVASLQEACYDAVAVRMPLRNFNNQPTYHYEQNNTYRR